MNEFNLEKYYQLLEDNKNESKIDFTKRVVNTKKPCLGILAPEQMKIVKSLVSIRNDVLDVMPSKYHEALMIDAYLINTIKDYREQIKYIEKLSKYIDTWSVTDSLKFRIKGNEQAYFDYAKQLLQSKKPFKRRIGIRIFFQYIKTDYIKEIFKELDKFSDEDEYYVNMAISWFLCESLIKNRDLTIAYFKNNKLNSFAINKAISKCHDSFRVSKEDKELLNNYKK